MIPPPFPPDLSFISANNEERHLSTLDQNDLKIAKHNPLDCNSRPFSKNVLCNRASVSDDGSHLNAGC